MMVGFSHSQRKTSFCFSSFNNPLPSPKTIPSVLLVLFGMWNVWQSYGARIKIAGSMGERCPLPPPCLGLLSILLKC